MNEVQIFNNEEFGQVRTLVINGEPWFVGKDVAEALGYSNASKAVSVHVSEEDRILKTLEADAKWECGKNADCTYQRIRSLCFNLRKQTGISEEIQELGNMRSSSFHPQAWNLCHRSCDR